MIDVEKGNRSNLRARSCEDVLEEVIFDDSGKSECVDGHCPLKQVLSLRGIHPDSYLSCYGGKVNDGCPVKLAVVGLGATPYEIARSKFLAQLKHNVGKNLGFDIHSDGALRVFENYGMERSFRREFERYMKGEIKVREIFDEVIRDLRLRPIDLVEITRRVLGKFIRRDEAGREYYERRTFMPVEFFG